MKVSICIPTYNQELYLEQAVRSAANQTIKPYEIIVSDDCSTDSTIKLLIKLSYEIPFLKVISQPKNIGISLNTNACLRLASGDFIIRLDSDDYLSPEFTKKLGEQLSKYPDAGYAHASVQEVSHNGKFLRKRSLFRSSGFQTSLEALKAVISGYRVAANIIMFRRTALLKVNFISTSIDFAEDYHLSASLAAKGFGNVYLDETLSFYRVWLDVKQVRQRRKLAEIIGLRKVFEEVIEPAFLERSWSLRELKSSRTKFACNHADCLSWNIYNFSEKQELITELKKLSSSPLVLLCIWMYLHELGILINSIPKIIYFPKSILKSLYLRYHAFGN